MATSHQTDQVVQSYRRALLGADAAKELSKELKEQQHQTAQAVTAKADDAGNKRPKCDIVSTHINMSIVSILISSACSGMGDIKLLN